MKKVFIIFAAVVLAISCEGKDGSTQDWPWEQPEADTPGDQNPDIPSEPDPEDDKATLDKWIEVSSNYGELPNYIKVYRSPDMLKGKKSIAYITVADMASAQWDIWSINDPEMDGTQDAFKTPKKIYDAGNWPIVINAGFFYAEGGKNYPASLAVRESVALAYNINYASEDWIDIYYPTRAAFLENTEGVFDACWTYKTYDNHYMYAVPAPNTWEADPVKQPSATYPEGGKVFAAKTAIGGGPLLIDDGEFKDAYVEELFNGASGIGPDSNQPRTAIGVTADKKMVLFVCEGRQMTQGVRGLTTADVANVLLDLGCVEAINLDGGGSSCMLVNGQETIKVSDGSQRAVGSTIMLK